MRYSNRISKWMLAAGMMLAGAAALPAADWRDSSYREQPAVRADYREVRRGYAAVDRLRDQIGVDRARLADDYRHGRRWAVDRDRAELNRHQRALDALLRDLRHDRDRR